MILNRWHIKRAAEHRTMPWRNGLGTTTELIVHPEGATLTDFDWRLSMAHVTADAPFSKFEGIDRLLIVLEGALTMDIEGTTRTLTDEDSPIAFAGEAAVSAKPAQAGASVLDLNLMLRRGKFSGRLQRRIIKPCIAGRTDPQTKAVLCRGPNVRVTDGTTTDVLGVNDLVVLDNPSTSLQLTCDFEASVYFVQLAKL
jgi:environmental stress-induced protein Ves